MERVKMTADEVIDCDLQLSKSAGQGGCTREDFTYISGGYCDLRQSQLAKLQQCEVNERLVCKFK